MKHISSILLALLLAFSLKTTAQVADSCGCVNCPGLITDGSVGQFYFHVNSAVNNDLADSLQGVCGIRMHFTHDYIGDLLMTLYSPGGQSVQLVGPIGYFNLTDTTDWDISFVDCNTPAVPDAGFNAIWNNNQPWGIGNHYSGSYYPNVGCLEHFNAGTVTGNWRLEVIDGQANDHGKLYNFEVLFCDTTGTHCTKQIVFPTALLDTSLVGWQLFVTNHSLNANTYQLSFGDGSGFNGINIPTNHIYADTGTYLLRLIAINQDGADTLDQNVHISGALPHITGIITNNIPIDCAPLNIQFLPLYPDHVSTYHWILPGAQPAESLEQYPQVMYDSTGIYSVTLIIGNSVGYDTITLPDYIKVKPELLSPGFTVQVQGDSIIATNTTQGFTNLVWYFNGVLVNTDSVQQVFVVNTSGNYLVTLFVENDCDFESIEQLIAVTVSGVREEDSFIANLRLLPNPTDGQCRLELTAEENSAATITVVNASGQVVYSRNANLVAGKNSQEFNLSNLPTGLYLLQLQTDKGLKSLPFTIDR